MISFKGRQFLKTMILMSVRWYLAYSLSYRNIEELMLERGVSVDHSTVNRWVIHYSPQLLESFKKKKNRVGRSWRMDETYIKIKGIWHYLYRAIDHDGDTLDFMLSKRIEQDHRFIKRLSRPMMGFKSFPSAAATLSGIELHHMIKKGQMKNTGNKNIFEQFYALAA
jgi:putative transposase